MGHGDDGRPWSLGAGRTGGCGRAEGGGGRGGLVCRVGGSGSRLLVRAPVKGERGGAHVRGGGCGGEGWGVACDVWQGGLSAEGREVRPIRCVDRGVETWGGRAVGGVGCAGAPQEGEPVRGAPGGPRELERRCRGEKGGGEGEGGGGGQDGARSVLRRGCRDAGPAEGGRSWAYAGKSWEERRREGTRRVRVVGGDLARTLAREKVSGHEASGVERRCDDVATWVNSRLRPAGRGEAGGGSSVRGRRQRVRREGCRGLTGEG